MQGQIPDEDLPPEPEIPSWLEMPWRAWHQLSTGRQYSISGIAVPMGGMVLRSRPLTISWLDMQSWCDRADCGEEERDFMCRVLDVMESQYMAWWRLRNGAGQ